MKTAQLHALWQKKILLWTYNTLSIHSSVVGYLGWFDMLFIVNNTRMNFDIQVSLWYAGLVYFE